MQIALEQQMFVMKMIIKVFQKSVICVGNKCAHSCYYFEKWSLFVKHAEPHEGIGNIYGSYTLDPRLHSLTGHRLSHLILLFVCIPHYI
jgi:hypothetical protein